MKYTNLSKIDITNTIQFINFVNKQKNIKSVQNNDSGDVDTDAIYNMHTYWSKKSHEAIREYIKKYSSPNDIIFDPFCGSGSTLIASLLENRFAIGYDISPIAAFISKNYCSQEDLEKIDDKYDELIYDVELQINDLYLTKCDRCNGSAITRNTIYSHRYDCEVCNNKITLYDCIIKDSKYYCPICYKKKLKSEINTKNDRDTEVPVEVHYTCIGKCSPKFSTRSYNDKNKKKKEYYEKYDLPKIRQMEKYKIINWYPDNKMMNATKSGRWGDLWRKGIHHHFNNVSELFTKRNLIALSLIKTKIDKIKNNDILNFIFTSSLFHVSKMAKHDERMGGYMMYNYHIPPLYKERMVLSTFEKKYKQIVKGLKGIRHNSYFYIESKNAYALEHIPNESIDYIFTDPPYSDIIQYGELNYVWESWLKYDTSWHKDEIIINNYRKLDIEKWFEVMSKTFNELYRVLKPDKWLSLCYHDPKGTTWNILQKIILNSKFILPDENNFSRINANQQSFHQINSKSMMRNGLVLNLYKSSTEINKEMIDEITGMSLIKDTIVIGLTNNPEMTQAELFNFVITNTFSKYRVDYEKFKDIYTEVIKEL